MIKRTYIGMVKLKIMLAARIVNRENHPITTYIYHWEMCVFEFIISSFFWKNWELYFYSFLRMWSFEKKIIKITERYIDGRK